MMKKIYLLFTFSFLIFQSQAQNVGTTFKKMGLAFTIPTEGANEIKEETKETGPDEFYVLAKYANIKKALSVDIRGVGNFGEDDDNYRGLIKLASYLAGMSDDTKKKWLDADFDALSDAKTINQNGLKLTYIDYWSPYDTVVFVFIIEKDKDMYVGKINGATDSIISIESVFNSIKAY